MAVRDDRGKVFPLTSDTPAPAGAGVMTLVGGVLGVFLVALFSTSCLTPLFGSAWHHGVVTLVLWAGLSWFWIRKLRAEWAQQLARIEVADRLCGSCGYPLADIQPAADGCRVCPECGAAWRV